MNVANAFYILYANHIERLNQVETPLKRCTKVLAWNIGRTGSYNPELSDMPLIRQAAPITETGNKLKVK